MYRICAGVVSLPLGARIARMNTQMPVGEPGGENLEPRRRESVSGLVENSAIDSSVDLELHGATSHLHCEHLPTPSSGHDKVLIHETSEGDTWLQVARHQTGDESLDDVVFASYRDLFSCIKDKVGSLVRTWNYIPRILSKDKSVIRYHRFNIGRKKAWELFGPKNADGQLLFPAATGIGTVESFFYIRALFSPHSVIRLQNPRQISPDKYSRKYGPLPPVFSRASILLKPERHQLFVSGTASIVGEDATYIGNPVLQTEESLTNIRQLIDGDNCRRCGYEGEFTLDDMKSMHVYVKRAEHFDCVRKTIQNHVRCPITYKRADICREDLLVEMECISERHTS
jgi:Chorismatase FkbO/Hyg5-like, N-terminal